MDEGRVFIIGLDGGSWNIIDPLMEEGVLPNLQRLLQEGAWGVLHSTLPPVTCPAWMTFSTSMKPSSLGIYEFRGMPEGSNRLSYHTYKELRYPEFWDLLMRDGRTCGIINDPLVYPLKEHEGYIVPGFITPQEEFKSYPESLLGELDEVTEEYELDQQGGFIIDDQTLLDGCSRVVGKRVLAMSYLLDRYPTDLFLGVFTSTDRAAHRFMNRAFLGEGEDSEQGWKALARIYGMVDEGIGRLLEMMHEDDFLILMSDHGFAARPWNLHVNQFLAEEGFLRVEVRGTLDRLGLTQRNLGKMLLKVGLIEKVFRLTPARLRNLIPAGESIYGEFFIHELMERGKLDWSKTRAICIGSGIYINTDDRPHGIVPSGEVGKIKQAIQEGLEGLRDPDGGGKGVRALEPEEVYGTGKLVSPPHLLLLGEGDWELLPTLPKSGEIFTRNQRAGHSIDGIFMLRHPWVKRGRMAEPMGIEDLAPMILHVFGVPAPAEMEGRVRLDAFLPDSPLGKEPSRSTAEPDTTSMEKERIKRRIARLKKGDSL
jgi:predicted AlkP superfamily phosphohydrolase/phosphomutase